MSQSTHGDRKSAFLPENIVQFLRRRLHEVAGLAVFVFAAAIAVALATYDPADPSLNVAAGTPVHNWLGLPGAVVADLVLQGLGLAGFLPVLALGAWAWRIGLNQSGHRFRWHALALLGALLTASSALAMLPAWQGWPLAAGLGGTAGDLVWQGLQDASATLSMTLPALPVSALFAAVSLSLLIFSLGLGGSDWLAMGRGTIWAARHTGIAAKLTAKVAGRWGREAARHAPFRREPRMFRSDEPVEDDDEFDEPPSRTELRPETPSTGRSSKRVVKSKVPLRKSRRARSEQQPKLAFAEEGDHALPPLHLLSEPESGDHVQRLNEEALAQNARMLESVLDDYVVRGRIIKVRPGPVVTLYELEPAPGTKTSRVIGLADDIARSMSARSVRIAVVPGRNAIGIELPNKERETVFLRELLSTPDYERSSSMLPLALGKDIGGAPVMADLAKMPHLLIAGTTGSGKSVAINTMILSLLYRMAPEQCRLIMIDPKMLELSVYDDIPHLLTPVVTDPGKAVMALKWTVREMENRYRAMAALGVRNISGYNQRLTEAAARGEELTRTVQTGFDHETGEPIFEQQALDMEPMPFIVVVVDEMADLMMVAGKDIEGAIQRLAQMARAAGIHIIMATQRPSVDVITGTIKANFPTRISFQVTAKVDSRTILGEQGAEQLLGMGDMLYMAGGGRISRVHGPFVSDEEVEEVVNFLKTQGRPEYLDEVTEEAESPPDGVFGIGMDTGASGGNIGSGDELFDQAVDVVARHQKASTSFLQRQLKIGYNRAADLIDRMEAEGVIGRANHVGKREVLVRNPDEEA